MPDLGQQTENRTVEAVRFRLGSRLDEQGKLTQLRVEEPVAVFGDGMCAVATKLHRETFEISPQLIAGHFFQPKGLGLLPGGEDLKLGALEAEKSFIAQRVRRRGNRRHGTCFADVGLTGMRGLEDHTRRSKRDLAEEGATWIHTGEQRGCEDLPRVRKVFLPS